MSTWGLLNQLRLVVNSSLPGGPEVTIGITTIVNSEESSKSAKFTGRPVSADFEPRIDTNKHEFCGPVANPFVSICVHSWFRSVSALIEPVEIHDESLRDTSNTSEVVYWKRLPSVDRLIKIRRRFLTTKAQRLRDFSERIAPRL